MNIKKNLKIRIGQKSQVHITETIGVLFVFFVLILLGLVFFYKFSHNALEIEKEDILARQAMDRTLKALAMPELICSNGEAEPDDNCIDLMKLRAANKTFKDNMNDYYFNVFGYSRISVYQIFPKSDEPLVIYDKPKPDYKMLDATHFIVSLKDEIKYPGSDYYAIGYLKLEVYS